jgi:hypothetical protein
MDFFSNLEDRFEPNALLANVPCRVQLAALTNAAYGLDMLLLKAVLIRVNVDLVLINAEMQKWQLAFAFCLTVRIILSILYKLVQKAGIARIQIGCKSMVVSSRVIEQNALPTFLLTQLVVAGGWISSQPRLLARCFFRDL